LRKKIEKDLSCNHTPNQKKVVDSAAASTDVCRRGCRYCLIASGQK